MLVPIPAFISQETWAAFCEMRRLKGQRAPFTEFAAKRIIGKLETFDGQGWDAEYILADAIENGWSSVFVTRDTPRRKIPTSPVIALMQKTDEPAADPARVASIMSNWRAKKVG